jgi:hypothetical protein
MRELGDRSARNLRLSLGVALAAALILAPRPLQAAFHIAVIDEVMTSYDGDDTVQFVEVRMMFLFQNVVGNSVFAAFDADGNYIDDILVVPSNVTNHGDGVRWIIGTEGLQTASGLTPDFIIPAGILPVAGGMVCFGGGFGAFTPADPDTWERTDFQNYIDCLAYGTYAGPTNRHVGTPNSASGAGHSLQRVSITAPPDNATNFACADTATPQNNAGDIVELPATQSCTDSPTASPTGTAATPTEAPTDTPTSTPTASPTAATPTATPTAPTCAGDCNNDGRAELDEIVRIVNVALRDGALGPCANADTDGDGHVGIDELVAVVANGLNECAAG